MKKYVQLIAFTCMAIAAILVAGSVMKSRTTQATVVKVSSLTVESSVTCSGKVERVSVRSVYPPAPAAVQKVYVEIGDHVEDGDPLMDILVTASASETEILQETYAALLSEYTQTEIPLSDFSSVGQEEDIQQLTAPISGEVTAVSITNQGTLEFGKPAITIASDEGLQVRLSVNESQISDIQVGQPAEITGVGFHTCYTGTVKSISSEAKQVVSTTGQETVVEVVVSVDNPGNDIKPGYTAKAKIITAQNDNVLIAPYEAVRAEEDGSEYVLKLKGQRAVKTPVETDGEFEDGFGVTSGIEEGDQIIMNPDSISDGEHVVAQLEKAEGDSHA